MQPIAGKTCVACGESLPETPSVSAELCPVCQEEPPRYERAVAFGAYDGRLRELIHLLKYEQVASAAGVLGSMLVEAIAKLELRAPVIVVPVPLHRSKRRQRGFNQSELIIGAALKKMPAFPGKLLPHALERVRPTVSQIGLTRPQRAENIRGAFKVAHLSRVSGANVLLIDDVLTTGTTISECARVLRRAGAEHVWAATVARTLKSSAAPSRVEGVAAA